MCEYALGALAILTSPKSPAFNWNETNTIQFGNHFRMPLVKK